MPVTCSVCYQSFPKRQMHSHFNEHIEQRSSNIYDEVQQQLQQQSQHQTVSRNSQIVDRISVDDFTENQQEMEPTNDESHDWDMFEIADIEENASLEIALMEDVVSTEEATTTQAICRRLRAFKNSIENPMHITIDDHAQTYLGSLSQSERSSLDLKSLLKENAVAKSTTEELFKFFNKYLKETGNGKT